MATYDELYAYASKHADLGVDHVWTNVSCKAYTTYDPQDCQCAIAEDLPSK